MIKRFLVGLIALTLLAVPAVGAGFRLGMYPAATASFNIAQYFNTTTYTGNATARSITTGIDLAANPGMVMVAQNSNSYPVAFDTLRGASNYLNTGSSNVELNDTNLLNAFNSNGFNYGVGGPGNSSGLAEAAWSIRQHPKLFNVITYTGTGAARAIAHGLTGAPGFVIIKGLSTATTGVTWHKSLTTGNYIFWAATAQTTASAAETFGNDTIAVAPDATSVYLGSDVTNNRVNQSGTTYVMYVYADDPTGYIVSGAYGGNGSTTGPIISLSWEPQWLLIKQRNSTGNWNVYDAARGFTTRKPWAPSVYTTSGVDITVSSTGFQLATADAAVNASGSAYIYTAIRKPLRRKRPIRDRRPVRASGRVRRNGTTRLREAA